MFRFDDPTPERNSAQEIAVEKSMADLYRCRKSRAKNHFVRQGGEANLEHVVDHPPGGMPRSLWKKACDWFCTADHKAVSERNKKNLAKQQPSRSGSRSYVEAVRQQV